MEVIKEMMVFTHRKAEGNTQIVMDDDRNVPDANADIARIMKQASEVQIDMVRILPDKVNVKGNCVAERKIPSLQGVARHGND